MPQPLLLNGEGEYVEPNSPEVNEQHLASLEDRLDEIESKLANVKRDAVVALLNLFSESMRQIASGKFDLNTAPTVQVDDRQSKVWESWKQRLGGSCAKVIDALLTHKDLNTQQLAIATGLHRTTIPNLIFRLNKAGLINKNGGRFSLKSL